MSRKNLLFLFSGGFLSVLIFFTISFISLIPYLIPWNDFDKNNVIDIGFPLIYYREFRIDCDMQGGWQSGLALPLDMLFSICLSFILLIIWGKVKKKNT